MRRPLALHVLGILFFTLGVLFSLSFATNWAFQLRLLPLSFLGGLMNYVIYRLWVQVAEQSLVGFKRLLGLAALVALGALPVFGFAVLLRLV